jgi:hypothetical protein
MHFFLNVFIMVVWHRYLLRCPFPRKTEYIQVLFVNLMSRKWKCFLFFIDMIRNKLSKTGVYVTVVDVKPVASTNKYCSFLFYFHLEYDLLHNLQVINWMWKATNIFYKELCKIWARSLRNDMFHVGWACKFKNLWETIPTLK